MSPVIANNPTKETDISKTFHVRPFQQTVPHASYPVAKTLIINRNQTD